MQPIVKGLGIDEFDVVFPPTIRRQLILIYQHFTRIETSGKFFPLGKF